MYNFKWEKDKKSYRMIYKTSLALVGTWEEEGKQKIKMSLEYGNILLLTYPN